MEKQQDLTSALNILALEDSGEDFKIIFELLLTAGFDFKMDRVENEHDFVSALKSAKYNIILADFNLPQYDFFEALKKAIEICPEIPFICVSGSIGEEAAIELIKKGAVDYVLKDKPQKLPFAVKRALEEAKEKKARKLAEEELKRSELNYRSLFENSVMGVSQALSDGSLICANAAYAQMYGYSSPEEMMANVPNVRQLYVHPLEREEVLRTLDEKGFMEPREITLLRRDRTRVTVLVGAKVIRDLNGKILCYQAEHVDITGRKHAEEELIKAKEHAEESEANFKLLNLLTSEMLLLQDLESIYKFVAENLQKQYPNAIVLYVSIDESTKQTRLEAVSGLDECILKKIMEISGFNPIGSVYKLKELHNNYFKSGSFIEFEGVLSEFAASEFPALVLNAIEKLIGLHKIYTIGINKDDELLAAMHFFTFNNQVITDSSFIEVFAKQAGLVLQKKINEKALLIAKEHAEESDRLKSAFLANMSHEIRTPMNGILGFADLLKEPNLTGEEQQNYIRIIQKSGERMLNIINDIVSISKIESGQMEVHLQEMNVNKQIEDIYTFFKPELRKKGMQFSFKNSLPIEDAILKTDSEKVYAILTNLVKNAIKFSDNGSIEFGYHIKDKYLEFYVKDTGIGIPKDRQEAIFERFIQADIADKMARQGAGLGLSISKAYIELLGGKIWMESEEGKGSTFYFTLPYQSEKVQEKNTKNEVLTPVKVNPVKKMKIVIADDDETTQMLISIAVREFGNEITSVKTGTKAVEACLNNPDINLVLMDILMPEMDGYEATRQIRKFNNDVIIIAQTAYALEGDREKALAAGCNDYIAKPIKAEELKQMIIKYLKR